MENNGSHLMQGGLLEVQFAYFQMKIDDTLNFIYSAQPNTYPDLIEGFTCSLLKDDISETECHLENMKDKKFFNDNQVLKRLNMLTPSKEYFSTINTVAFKNITKEEKSTPIAFSILCHSNFGILEALLASIFRPHNSYCIYVDSKAPPTFLDNVKRLINAYKMKFPKSALFLAAEPRMSIFWGSATLLEAGLSCMEELLKKSTKWKYFLNTVGTALPMVSVQKLAKILSELPENEDIIMSQAMPPDKEKLQTHKYTMVSNITYDSIKENKNLEGHDGGYSKNFLPQRTQLKKEKPPHNLKIRWGWTESIVSRNTAKMILTRKPVENLRNWVQDVFFPEEFFYATLATMNKAELKKGNVIQNLNKDTSNGICIRKSLWSEDHIGTKAEDRYNCKGVVKRGICNLSIDDLPEIFKSGCLYANKFDLMANDGLVIKCMHEYLTQ